MATELTPVQAEKEWKSGKFRPVYLLIGDEASAKATFISKLKAALKPDVFNLNELSADSPAGIQEVVSSALTPPMLSERRLVICKNPKLGIEARKALARYLKEPLRSTVLAVVLEDRKPDYREVLVAAAAALEGVILFKPLREEEAVSRLREAAVRADTTFDEEAARLLVQESGTDWGILQAELEKLVLFSRGCGAIRKEDVLACLGYRRASNPFDFPRVLQGRDRVHALRQLRRLLAEGVEPFRILYQISGAIQKQLKAKRMAAAGRSDADIFRELRLNSYFDRDFLRQLPSVSEARLIAELRACVNAESSLKSKTWLEPGIELERLVAEIGKN